MVKGNLKPKKTLKKPTKSSKSKSEVRSGNSELLASHFPPPTSRFSICHMPTQLHISNDAAAVARDFARYFAEQLVGQEHFSVALSGGSTPKILFQLWVEEYHDLIDWSKIHFFWGDERCVPPTHEESNYGVAKALLFDRVSVPAENIHRIKGEDDPASEAKRYAIEIDDNTDEINDLPAFDLIILGMGDDGHTASIFPHQIELLAANQLVVTANHPQSGQKRISFSGQLINNAKEVAFLVTGQKKKEKVRAILNKQSGAKAYPASHIKPRSGELHWFIDRAAWE